MTNKQKYKQAFSALHPSHPIDLEVSTMNHTNTRFLFRPVAAIVSILLLLGCAGVAYAADIGGIRQTIQVWLHGDLQDMEVTGEDGHYQFHYKDDPGKTPISGGGIEIDQDGNATPLSPEDVAQTLADEIGLQSDGKIWLYYKSYAIDITDRMTDTGCKLVLTDEGTQIYFDIDAPNEFGSCSYHRAIGSPEGDPQDYTPIN